MKKINLLMALMLTLTMTANGREDCGNDDIEGICSPPGTSNKKDA